MISCACFIFSALNSKAIYSEINATVLDEGTGRPLGCCTVCHGATHDFSVSL